MIKKDFLNWVFRGTKICYLLAIKKSFFQHVSNFIRLQVMKENRKIIQVEKKVTQKNNLAKNGLSESNITNTFYRKFFEGVHITLHKPGLLQTGET
jgi:hypothetical protein